MSSQDVKTVVVVNPRSGRSDEAPPVSERLSALGPVRVEQTSEPGHAQSIAAAAVEAGAERVVAVGGDGTLHEIVNGLAGHGGRCALGIVPSGTGNDTARSLGIPLAEEDAIELIAHGSARPVDLVEVDIDGQREYALNAVTGGFGGEVAERVTDELKDRWGALAYLRTAAEALKEVPSYPVRVQVDGEEPEALDVFSLVVGNGPYAARGVCVAPGARPDDGRLSVHAVLEAPVTELLSLVPALIAGHVPESPLYLSWSCERLVVTAEHGMDVSVDGELRHGRRFVYRVIPGALPVYRPPRRG